MPRLWPANPKKPTEILVPQDEQWNFIRLSETTFATFLAGGWGASKTYALLLWTFYQAMRNPPGTTGIIIIPTYLMLEEYLDTVLIPAFKNIIVGHAKKKNTLYLVGNRRLIYKSGHNPERIEMSTACYLAVDECGLMDRSIFYRAVARARDERGDIKIGMVGVPIWGWLREEFEGRNDEKRKIMHVRTYDNKYLHKDYLDNLQDAIPATQARMYIEGHFCPPGSATYPEMDESIHLIPWDKQMDLPVITVIDWGYRRPHVLFVNVVPKGYKHQGKTYKKKSWVIFDELMPSNITTENLCIRIRDKGYPIAYGICDKAGEQRQSSSGLTDIHIAKQILGIRMKYKTSPRLTFIPAGVTHVRRMLMPLDNEPTLFFAKHMKDSRDPRSVWNSMCSLSYPLAKDGKPIDDHPEKNGVTDHATDDVRYLSINEAPIIELTTNVRSIA
jgi:hypothetical protein